MTIGRRKTSLLILLLTVLIAAVCLAAGTASFAVAAGTDLESALAAYGTFDGEKNMLAVDGYDVYAVSNEDGLDDSLFEYDGGTLTVSSESIDGGTVRVTNDIIEAGTVMTADGVQRRLEELPTLYAAKLTFAAVDDVAWHGGGLAFGFNESGYAITFRAMVNGAATVNMKAAESNYDWNATDVSMAGHATAIGVQYELAAVRNGLNYKFFIDGRYVGFVNLPDTQGGKSNQLKRSFFGVAVTTGCKLAVTDMKMMPLADIPDYELNIPSDALDVLVTDGVTLARESGPVSYIAESAVRDGQLWQKKEDSDWKYIKADESALTSILGFRAAFTDAGDGSSLSVKIREQGTLYTAVEFTEHGVSVYDGADKIETADVSAIAAGAREIMILSAPYKVSVWIDGIKAISAALPKTDVLGNPRPRQSGTCEFTAVELGVNLTALYRRYPTGVLLENPNAYPPGEEKGDANLTAQTAVGTPDFDEKLFVVLLVFGILFVLAAVGGAVWLILYKRRKRKNKEENTNREVDA